MLRALVIFLVIFLPSSAHGQGLPKIRAAYTSISIQMTPLYLMKDLDLPRKHGLEVLEWIRRQPALTSLRIVVLTSSGKMQEANRAYQLGANSFLVKPIDFIDFVRLTQAINGGWLWVNREFTPPGASPDPS